MTRGEFHAQFNVLIVESDKSTIDDLIRLLKKEQALEVNAVHLPGAALQKMQKEKPDLLIINPAIDDGAGFELLDEVLAMENHPETVVVVRDEKEAQKAFRINVASILSKPVDPGQLSLAIQYFLLKRSLVTIKKRLMETEPGIIQRKIMFSTKKGYVFLDAHEIIHCEADSNYTHLFLTGGRKITISKTLHQIADDQLTEDFFRISRATIINVRYLVDIDRNEKKCTLRNHDQHISLPITPKYIKPLLDFYSDYYSINQ